MTWASNYVLILSVFCALEYITAGILMVLSFVVVNFLIFGMSETNSTDPQLGSVCAHEQFHESPEWVKQGGFVILIICICLSYWGMATICEQILIPALNFICEATEIPDDIAGVTVMAAGSQVCL